MKQNFFLFLFLTTFNCLLAQNNVAITVTDVSSGLPIQSAEISLGSTTLQTDSNGQVVFTDLANGSYSYTISKTCYLSTDDEVVIAGSNVSINQTLSLQDTNNIYVSMSNFGFNPSGFSVNLSNGSGFNQTITSGNPLGDMFENVPFGTYAYTITKNCFQTATGEVTVNCNGGDPNVIFSVPVAVTSNNVYVSMSNFGFNPSGFSVNLSNSSGFSQTITSGNPLGDIFENIPFGTYTYTITKNCFQAATGEVTVNCNGGDPSVIFSVPAAVTTNNIYVSMSNFGFNPSGFSVNLSNGSGFSQTITSGNPLGDMFENVPFGTYAYTITKNCFQAATGEVTVNCNGGDPNVIFSVPVAVTSNNVYVSMSNFGFNPSGFSVSLSNSSGFNQTITSGNPLGDMFENVPFGTYAYTITKNCFQTVTGEVTVNCNGGDPNVIFSVPAAVTTNSVFFFLSNFGFNPEGFSINLTDGGTYNQTITSGNPLSDIIENVPFGTYTYTISKVCHQTITGQVTVNCNNGEGNIVSEIPVEVILNSEVIQTENVLTATETAGVTYQWVDCNNNNSPIENETNQVFTATTNGSYAVEISNANCSTVSGCFTVSNLSVENSQKTVAMSVYPNPADDSINVKFEKNFETLTVEIISITGQVVKTVTAAQNNTVSINISDLAQGVYVLKTDDKENSIAVRIVKK